MTDRNLPADFPFEKTRRTFRGMPVLDADEWFSLKNSIYVPVMFYPPPYYELKYFGIPLLLDTFVDRIEEAERMLEWFEEQWKTCPHSIEELKKR